MSFFKENKFNLFLIFLWFFIVLTVVCCHEIWRDEAQAWCLVRDTGIWECIRKIRIEAHPLLWYSLLFPFAKFNFPVETMQIISFLLVFASVVFFVLKSSFSVFFKTIVIFGSGMLYYMPVIARNYSLIPIFLFLLAFFYKERINKPLLYTILIIFLMNTHGLMFGFSGILSFLYTIDIIKKIKETGKYSYIIYPLILFISLFCLFLFLNISITDNMVIESYRQFNNYTFIEKLKNFALLFFNGSMPGSKIINISIFYFALLSLLIIFIKKDKNLFCILFFSLIFMFYVYSEIWFSGIPYQKAFILMLIILFCSWVFCERYKSKFFSLVITIIFLLGFIPSFSVIQNEIKNQFSGSRQISEYIKNNLNDEKTFIAVGYPCTFTGISAYLPDKKFFSYLNNYYISYYNFDANEEQKYDKMPDSKYFIVQSELIMNNEFEKIFSSAQKVLSSTEQKESFSIYKIKESIN